MQFSLEMAIPVLERTPTVLKALLQDISTEWTHENEGPDTWSPFNVVGHLIHGERTDWMARARTILQQGESQPFKPFDRFAQFEESKGKSMHMLLDELAELRAENLASLKALELSARHFELCGTHPELGPVTLGELLATWVVHDLGHIAQIARVMAKQLGNEVGPWEAYLGVLGRANG